MRYTIFGESHGPAVGVVLEGVPPGLVLDLPWIAAQMARRAPGNSPLSSPRREADQVRLLSGVFGGRTTGTPLCAVIENTDARPEDYAPLCSLPRPSHGDYTGHVRYRGCGDPRGGGRFSGRLTAPLVWAGSVARLLLRGQGVEVTAGISCAGGIQNPSPDQLEACIAQAAAEGDSVGGVISCQVTGLPPGLGAPDFGQNGEGIFAQHLFAVPGVKGVSFGAGFDLARMRGSQANDPFYFDGGAVRTRTNHAGGLNGGITNGMPVTLQAVIRPTPSIAREQETVNLADGQPARLAITGRHDPCILPRAVVVIESAAALAAWQLMELGAQGPSAASAGPSASD